MTNIKRVAMWLAIFLAAVSHAHEYTPKERECYDGIFLPAQTSYLILQERAVRGREFLGLESGIPNLPDFNVDRDTTVKALAENLDPVDMRALGLMQGGFLGFMLEQEQYNVAYLRHIKDLGYLETIGGPSLAAAIISFLAASVAQAAQMACDKYECVYDSYNMLKSDNGDGGPDHFCFQKGVDWQCAQFWQVALGHNDLTKAKYQENCSKFLNTTINPVDSRIPLGEIRHEEDLACQIALGITPFTAGLALLIPPAALSVKSSVSYVQLRLSRRRLNKLEQAPDVDFLAFGVAVEKVRAISVELAKILELAGNFYRAHPQGQTALAHVFYGEPFGRAIAALVRDATHFTRLKAGWRRMWGR
jgi:hypothetical protein